MTLEREKQTDRWIAITEITLIKSGGLGYEYLLVDFGCICYLVSLKHGFFTA
jgi:hypothetical protein